MGGSHPERLMRVLHVIPAVAARYGGPSQAIVGMGRALCQHGVQVLIATTDADGSGRLPVQHGVEVTWQGVPAIFFTRQWTEAFKYSRPLAVWLNRQVGAFDVVHIHAVFSHACIAAAQAARKASVPYVVRPLGTLDPWSLRQKPIRKRVLWYTHVRRMLDGAAAIHFTTAAEQRLAQQPLGLARGTVIPLGVDDSLFSDAQASASRQEADPFVLVLGRLHPKKRLESLFEVFLEVTSQPAFRHWRLVVVGDGQAEYVATLRNIVSQLGGDQRVVFAGWLDGADKRSVLQRAALLALPSQQENFGLVVAEALACGTPVLISEHVNLADDVSAAGAGWVVPLERAALRESLGDALADDDERQRRGAAGRALARAQFTWPAVARHLTEMYSSAARAN
jgi:glycosyltransferase involved in cell wall biosynthesis